MNRPIINSRGNLIRVLINTYRRMETQLRVASYFDVIRAPVDKAQVKDALIKLYYRTGEVSKPGYSKSQKSR
ncbi:hypothetical protein D6817_03345 [Candidatus Pacearchaeota archaeon]|nr:MAG: hypothetical protein D6817_03345 [Candidatus Pacearchaeota archaeon]